MFSQGPVHHVLSDIINDCTAPSGHHRAQQYIVNYARCERTTRRSVLSRFWRPRTSVVFEATKIWWQPLPCLTLLRQLHQDTILAVNVCAKKKKICPWLTCVANVAEHVHIKCCLADFQEVEGTGGIITGHSCGVKKGFVKTCRHFQRFSEVCCAKPWSFSNPNQLFLCLDIRSVVTTEKQNPNCLHFVLFYIEGI